MHLLRLGLRIRVSILLILFLMLSDELIQYRLQGWLWKFEEISKRIHCCCGAVPCGYDTVQGLGQFDVDSGMPWDSIDWDYLSTI